MNKETKKLDMKTLLSRCRAMLRQAGKYKVVAFVVFVAILYGFIWLKINSFTNAQPSSSQVDSQVQAAAIPHIDQSVLNQLQSLQNNSVNVQALFNQSRNNPFSQ